MVMEPLLEPALETLEQSCARNWTSLPKSILQSSYWSWARALRAFKTMDVLLMHRHLCQAPHDALALSHARTEAASMRPAVNTTERAMRNQSKCISKT
jgi:hypothetical protein